MLLVIKVQQIFPRQAPLPSLLPQSEEAALLEASFLLDPESIPQPLRELPLEQSLFLQKSQDRKSIIQ
jgi:hypothetical protein